MNNEKLQKILRVIIIVLFTITIFLGAYKALKKDNNTNNAFSKEYPNVNTDNMYTYEDIQDAINKIENGTGMFFFCNKDIDNCKEVAQYLYEEAKDLAFTPIHYIDIKDLNEEYTNKLKEITKNEEVKYPLVIAVNKKEFLGSITISEDSKSYWTKENIEKFKIEVMNHMNKMKGNTCDDECE